MPVTIEKARTQKTATPLHPANRLGLMVVTTSHVSLKLMRGQFRFLREAGFDVTIVAPPGEYLDRAALKEKARAIAIPMAQEISPARDFVALWRIYHAMRRLKPAVASVGTPKAGVLGGMAAWLARVPCRVYLHYGARAETLRGFRQRVLLVADRLACRTAHRVICVSESLRRRILDWRLTAPEKAIVLGAGSSNGVDAERFAPTPARLRAGRALREKLGIPVDAPVAGFIGRFTRDQGVAELFDAFVEVRQILPEARLLVLGDFEAGDPISQGEQHDLAPDPNIIRAGFVEDAAPYYHAMDVLVLPTQREGFPNAALEAHAAEKPVVALRATGTVDAVRDGVDGILVSPSDRGALGDAIAGLLEDAALRRKMGEAGRERAIQEFSPERIWMALLDEYTKLFRSRGLPFPELHRPAATKSAAAGRGAT